MFLEVPAFAFEFDPNTLPLPRPAPMASVLATIMFESENFQNRIQILTAYHRKVKALGSPVFVGRDGQI